MSRPTNKKTQTTILSHDAPKDNFITKQTAKAELGKKQEHVIMFQKETVYWDRPFFYSVKTLKIKVYLCKYDLF